MGFLAESRERAELPSTRPKNRISATIVNTLRTQDNEAATGEALDPKSSLDLLNGRSRPANAIAVGGYGPEHVLLERTTPAW